MAVDTTWSDPSTGGTIDLNTGGILTETIYDKILSNLKRLGGTDGNTKTGDLGIGGAPSSTLHLQGVADLDGLRVQGLGVRPTLRYYRSSHTDGDYTALLRVYNGTNLVGQIGSTNENSEATSGGWEFNCYDAGVNKVALRLYRAGRVDLPNISTTASAANAFLDSAAANSILRSTSSLRYKRDLAEITAQEIAILDKLHPFTYSSLCPADDPKARWFGLGAEEVADVEPRLVHFNKEGEPESVMYDRIVPLLLAKVQHMETEMAQLRLARRPLDG